MTKHMTISIFCFLAFGHAQDFQVKDCILLVQEVGWIYDSQSVECRSSMPLSWSNESKRHAMLENGIRRCEFPNGLKNANRIKYNFEKNLMNFCQSEQFSFNTNIKV